MKAVGFAPAHISGFFAPYYSDDLARTGSYGAGFSVQLGAISEVCIEESKNQSFEFFINDKKCELPVADLALKYLIGSNSLQLRVNLRLGLPFGQGFGMSAASALSTCLAVSKLTSISKSDALKASHFAEVKLRTGLGDVMGSYFGGFEIRKSPGIPPWGVIEHIPGDGNFVLCVVGDSFDTSKLLNDKSKLKKIDEIGRVCLKKILKKPHFENFFKLSRFFSEETRLATPYLLKAMDAADDYGKSSMCMLGNSIFAMGETDDLIKVLSPIGKVFVCPIDKLGARILDL